MKVNAADPSCASGSSENDAVSAPSAGPGTVAATACDSFLPSPVQTAPAAVQSRVAGSVISTAPSPSGATSTVQLRALPCVTGPACVTRPPATPSAAPRSAAASTPSTSSLNVSVKVNALDPSCASGSPENDAVSGTADPASMLRIVPVAVASAIAAPEAFESVSVKVSPSSSTSSSISRTGTVPAVRPAAIASVPRAAT